MGGEVMHLSCCIDPAQSDPADAIKELHEAIAAVNASMAALAKLFPGTTAITGFSLGQPCLTLAFARSKEADHFNGFSVMNAAKGLARIVIAMLPELQDVFAIELKYAAETRRINLQMEAVAEAALRAAAKKDADAGNEF
jgi:CRISPR/Cas system CMR-associated protein Cmr5 small subunit